MATILRHPSIAVAPAIIRVSSAARSVIPPHRVVISSFWSARPSNSPVVRRFVPLVTSGDAESVETAEYLEGTPVEKIADDEEISDTEEEPASAVLASLEIYNEALASEDNSKIAEMEAFLKSIEDEKNSLELKVAALSTELSIEKDRVLRISVDFDNFRKRTERELLSLVTNAQGEVVENFLSVLDNFERAKTD